MSVLTTVQKPAIDAFDIDAVQTEHNAYKPRRPADRLPDEPDMSEYQDYIDETVYVLGEKVDIRLCYPNDRGEIDAYALDSSGKPAFDLVSGAMDQRDYVRCLTIMEERSFEREAEEKRREAKIAEAEYNDRKYCEMMGK